MVNLETASNNNNNTSSGSADLLGLGLAGGGDGGGGNDVESPSVNGNGFAQETTTNNLTKYVTITFLHAVRSYKGLSYLVLTS